MYPHGSGTLGERHPNWGHPDHDACGTGFVARLGGPAGYDIIQHALTALERLTHRGGVDADGASGDGAGLLTSLPEEFFRASAKEQGIELAETFGVGCAFFTISAAADARSAIEAWRKAKGCASRDGVAFRWMCDRWAGVRSETMPEIWQFFVEAIQTTKTPARFERRLAMLRKRAEVAMPARCYVCSLSSRTVVYKGLLTPSQFPQFYEDLRDTSFATTFAIFHQRYSTNTQPSWDLAQPFRHVAHNGEINTIVSNRRWLRAKQREQRAALKVGAWFRALEPNVSDSASFDNAFEVKLLEGLSPEQAMLALVPPAFEKDPLLSRDVRAALTTLSQTNEPWDGPAALVFSDGQFVGAKLDRNGLRPLRYTLTHDGLLVAGSETGLIDFGRIAHCRAAAAGAGRNDSCRSGVGIVFAVARHFEAPGRAQRLAASRRLDRFVSAGQRQRCRGNRTTQADRGGGRLDGRPVQNIVLRAGTRQRSGLEHGRRRSARVSVDLAAHAVGLLQAAFCASHQSAD